jgi:hypothetical protein
MSARPNPALADRLDRRVLYAVELWDGVTRLRVDRGVSVVATGLRGKPIMSLTGRYVWLTEGNAWPTRIAVLPHPGTPYVAMPDTPALPKPGDLEHAPASERLHAITLQPNAAYPLPGGLTIMRGRLRTSASPGGEPVAGVMIDWRVKGFGAYGQAAPDHAPMTDGDGAFVAYVARDPHIDPKHFTSDGRINVRLRFLVDSVTYVTPDDFDFYGRSGPYADFHSVNAVFDGHVLPRELDLSLDRLKRI